MLFDINGTRRRVTTRGADAKAWFDPARCAAANRDPAPTVRALDRAVELASAGEREVIRSQRGALMQLADAGARSGHGG